MMMQTYLNPFYRSEAQGAAYGWCALSHWTEKAGKIQNIALRILSLILAVLFDATIGFGLISSLSYNSGAFLYNSYGKAKHFTQKYRGIEENRWNKTALKTWAFIGSASALAMTLYYLVALGAMRQGILSSQLSQASSSSAIPSASDILQKTNNPLPEVGKNRLFSLSSMACLGGASLLTGIGARIGYLYYLLPKYDPKAHLQFQTHYNLESCAPNNFWPAIESTMTELNRRMSKWKKSGSLSVYEKPWVYNFSNGQIRFLQKLNAQCSKRFHAEWQTHLKEKNLWNNRKVCRAADRWMKVSYTLSCLVLEDLDAYARNIGVSPQKIMCDKSSPPLHFCTQTLENYQLLRFLDNREETLLKTFYGEGTHQRYWLELHNDLCKRLLAQPGMKKLAETSENFRKLTHRTSTGSMILG